jgi:peptidoglycan/LPS O-acetylase OafA/YrhL
MSPPDRGKWSIPVAISFVAGIVLCVALAMACHVLGIGLGFSEQAYPYTGAITSHYVPVFMLGGPAAAVYAARHSRRSWPFALGLIVPLAVALAIEVSLDPTSHNLFPFEVVLVWLPAFLLSLGTGAIALMVARRTAPRPR